MKTRIRLLRDVEMHEALIFMPETTVFDGLLEKELISVLDITNEALNVGLINSLAELPSQNDF